MHTHVEHKMFMEGEYTLTVGKEGTNEKRTIGPFKNLITNQGLNSFGVLGSSFSLQAAMVGTSSTPPAVTDTNLGNRLRNTLTVQGTDSSTNLGAPDYAGQIVRTWRFAAGEATGNLTEVGVGSASSPTNNPTLLFSHALIVDSGGNPVTLTVLADEYLDVTYTLRIYPDLTDKITKVLDEISGVEYTFTSRVYDVTTFKVATSGNIYLYRSSLDSASAYSRSVSGTPITLAAVTSATPLIGAGGGSTCDSSASTSLSYVSGSYTSGSRLVWSLNQGNFGLGIQGLSTAGLQMACDMKYQILVDPPIMKTNIKTLTLEFSINWARRP